MSFPFSIAQKVCRYGVVSTNDFIRQFGAQVLKHSRSSRKTCNPVSPLAAHQDKCHRTGRGSNLLKGHPQSNETGLAALSIDLLLI